MDISRHNNYIKELFFSQPLVIVIKNLTSLELTFLNSLLSLLGTDPLPYAGSIQYHSLKNNDIVLLSELNELVIKDCLDWNLPVMVLGRLSKDNKEILFQLGVSSFWDLEKTPIQSVGRILFQSVISDLPISCLVWTNHIRFNEQIKNIFRAFSVRYNIASKPEYSLSAIQENEYNLVVLDWDSCGLETLYLVNKLKQLKGKKESFPCLLGIKDLDRPNVYQELIGGMKDLCPVLFNHNEVLKLFLSSLPFKKSPKENVVQDRVVLKCKTTQGKAIVSIAREENHKEENIEEYLIDTSLIKRQFEWLDGML